MDLIDRQQAIDAMCDACYDWCDEGVCKKVSAIQKMSSVQPERKKGRWIDKGMEGSWNYCSVCGEQAIDPYDYCPNCGADMRGESE